MAFRPTSSTRPRWGDYSAAAVSLDGTIWMATEMIPGGARKTFANWGTSIAGSAPAKTLRQFTVQIRTRVKSEIIKSCGGGERTLHLPATLPSIFIGHCFELVERRSAATPSVPEPGPLIQLRCFLPAWWGITPSMKNQYFDCTAIGSCSYSFSLGSSRTLGASQARRGLA